MKGDFWGRCFSEKSLVFDFRKHKHFIKNVIIVQKELFDARCYRWPRFISGPYLQRRHRIWSNGSYRWNHFFYRATNTVPNAVTQEILEEKYQVAAERSYTYSFMMRRPIIWKVLKTNQKMSLELKYFLGSSQYMLVDNETTLEKFFSTQCLLLFIVKMKLLYKTI
jgi:hypothetical protein